MILEAARTHNIDLDQSFLVGDRATDIVAAKNAKVRPILVLSGRGRAEAGKVPPGDCLIAEDLYDAVTKYIVSENREP
jgi:histidinol phosphatase-like enzyme